MSGTETKTTLSPLRKQGGTGRKERSEILAERREGGGLLKFDSWKYKILPFEDWTHVELRSFEI